jgi:2-hydroxychromene-2-carboxylate isomerase
MERWKTIRCIPLVTWPKFYPADPSLGHRMLLAVIAEHRDIQAFAHAGLKAVWADELNVEDPDTLIRLAEASGFDGRHLHARATEERVVQQETNLTAEAVGLRCFGAPFYIYRGEPFWGQDRLDQLEQAIVSGRPPIVPVDDP